MKWRPRCGPTRSHDTKSPAHRLAPLIAAQPLVTDAREDPDARGPKALSRRGPHRTPWHLSFETPWTWADASRRRRCRRCDPGRTRREKGDARRYAQERGRLIGDRSMPPGAGLPDGETCETRAGHEPVCRSTTGASPPERDLQTGNPARAGHGPVCKSRRQTGSVPSNGPPGRSCGLEARWREPFFDNGPPGRSCQEGEHGQIRSGYFYSTP